MINVVPRIKGRSALALFYQKGKGCGASASSD
jgi:hypothetical protein